MKKIMFNDRYGLTENTSRLISKGTRFGRLTVIGVNHKGTDRKYYYDCLCDCGNRCIVRSNSLTTGNTKSCGCMVKESKNVKHGMKHTRLYGIWCGMRDRCNNEKNPAYKRYGGKGITVCKEWNEFISFYKWSMSNGYNESLSIDRINVNGNYEPSNCRWATPKEQSDNKSCNIIIELNGKKQDLQQWCDELGFNRSTINTRVRMCGWSYEKALTTPIRKHKKNINKDEERFV